MWEKFNANRWVRPWNTLGNILGNSCTIKANQRAEAAGWGLSVLGTGSNYLPYSLTLCSLNKATSLLSEAKLSNGIIPLVLTCSHTDLTRQPAWIIFWSRQPLLCSACFHKHLLAYDLLLSGKPVSPPLFFPRAPERAELFPGKSHGDVGDVRWCRCDWWCLSSWVQVLLWEVRSSSSLWKAAFPILGRVHFKLLQFPLTLQPIPCLLAPPAAPPPTHWAANLDSWLRLQRKKKWAGPTPQLADHSSPT